jgi:hypothetical protein
MAGTPEDFGELSIGPSGSFSQPVGKEADIGEIGIGPVGAAPKQPAQEKVAGPIAGVGAPLQPIGKPEPADIGVGEMFSQALQSAPSSAVEFGKSIIHPFMHPIETASAIGALGKGAYSKAAGALGVEQDKEQKAKDEAAVNALADFYRDRYGSVARFKQAFAKDPVGVLADASTVLTGGGSLAAKAPGLIGKAGEAAAAVGRTVDPVAAALKVPAVTAKGVSTVLNVPLSLHSGSSFRSLQQATNAGLTANPVFMEHLVGSVPPTELVRRVNEGISKVAQQRSAEYLAGMGRIASTQPLPFNKVDDALRAAQSIAYHKGSAVNPEAAVILQRMENIVSSWRNNPQMIHNIEDFDKLKQALRNTGYAETYKGTPARKIVDDIANAAKDTIPDRRYAEIMENYQRATQELIDLNKELTARGGSSLTQIRKILRSQDTRAKGDLIKRLEKLDPDLPYAIAGAELNPLIPQGIRGQIAGMLATGSLGGIAALAAHPAPLAGLAFSSPKIVGMTAYGIGRAGGLPSRTYQALPAPQMLGQAAEAARITAPEDRPARATGGAVNLKALANAARKAVTKSTEDLLKTPDEHVVKALEIANRQI